MKPDPLSFQVLKHVLNLLSLEFYNVCNQLLMEPFRQGYAV